MPTKDYNPNQLKWNTGTNLAVRTTLNLINDGWEFKQDGDRIISASNQQHGEYVHFYTAGDLKKWLEAKAEDF